MGNTQNETIEETRLLDQFPVLSKVLSIKTAETTLGKILWCSLLTPSALLGGCVDLILLICITIGHGVKYVVKRIIDAILEKFIGIILLTSAIAISVFFIFFFIKTGLWKNLFDFCYSLFAE